MSMLEGQYLKPLLTISKEDLRNYLIANKFEWREDASNADSKYKRNLVRNEVLPLLSKVCGSNSALQSRLFNLADQSSDLRHWIVSEVFFNIIIFSYFIF